MNRDLIFSCLIILTILIGFPIVHAESVPGWVKNTAGWWAEDAISETEFVNAIEFLINIGIIEIDSNEKCVDDFLKYFDDKEEILKICKEDLSDLNDEIIPYDIDIKFNDEGFRGVNFSVEKSPDVFRIVMLGGSTMVGAEVSNEHTIPSILQKMLEKELPDGKFEVINAGVSGGTSQTEYYLFEKIQFYDADLFIIYDGWNDLSADYAVGLTEAHWEGMCEVGEILETDVVIALQPIAGFGNKVLTEQEKINALTGKNHRGFQLIQDRSTYDYLERELNTINRNCDKYDLRNIFDEITGPVYWDQGHVLHAGNLVLAEKFLDITMEKINPSYIPDRKFTEIISNYNRESVISYLFTKLDINEISDEDKIRDVYNNMELKGDYFKLKNEFGDIKESFVGKDLRNIDLSKLDLSGQDLTGANLSGMDLRNIDLSNTIIQGANLSYTNLEGKNFSGMDLRGVNFNSANMQNVDLRNATIGKILQTYGVRCMDENSTMLLIKNFICASEIFGNESIRTSFTNTNLSNAIIGSTEDAQIIHFSDFTNAKLNNATIKNVKFGGCLFQNTELNGINADEITIVSSIFENVKMNNLNAELFWIHTTSIINSEFTNNIITEGFFYNSDFTNSNLENTEFKNTVDIFKKRDLRNNFSCENNIICN